MAICPFMSKLDDNGRCSFSLIGQKVLNDTKTDKSKIEELRKD